MVEQELEKKEKESGRFDGKIEKVGTADKALSLEEIKITHELLERDEIEGFKLINNILYIFEKEEKDE